jgi:hypothetical protein
MPQGPSRVGTLVPFHRPYHTGVKVAHKVRTPSLWKMSRKMDVISFDSKRVHLYIVAFDALGKEAQHLLLYFLIVDEP